ncbi:hypothetical protein M426DRAFT_25275 [Hypoxylon sp. CI-4A]|nr:hypothetical protein M426DRAFT_25275 [Hypoxylon sp. CI-4A]
MSTHSADLLGLYDNGPSTQSPGLTLNLSSNNPFRNRAASPNALSPPHSPFDDPLPPPRPTSRNPFLDPSNQPSTTPASTLSSSDKMASTREQKSMTAEEMFDNLILDDGDAKSRSTSGRPSISRPPTNGPPRGENNPPRGRGGPPPSHKPTRSQEEAMRARRMHSASNGGDKLMPSPQKKSTERRPRRNSDSSMMEKPPLTDEEKKARELRRKERERRHRDGKDKKTGRKLDIIDQLDATSIYGTGLFHHDGPFDACNPHRNRKGSRRAPMQAFAKDSANNSIGGSGPLNQRPDHAQFMGQEPHDASNMFGTVAKGKNSKNETTLFDPKQASEYVPGEETLGLGSSTFLEGTPATRAAIQRNEDETAQVVMEQGLGRKKSVVQRFRSIKRAPREYSDSGRVTSPDGAYYTPKTGSATGGSISERNPFFAEYDKTDERISVKRTDSNPRSPASPPVPGASLERRATNDGVAGGDANGNGFLNRVRSLKGGRRQRPEPPSKESLPPAPGMAI